MITIGLEGKPGSGKTTLSRELAKHPDVVHIEVDKIVEKLCLVKIRDMVLGYANRLVKQTLAGTGRCKIVGRDPRTSTIKIATPKILVISKDLFYGIVMFVVKRKIDACRRNGVKIVLIDYALLNVSNIWNRFDYRVCVIKNEEQRILAVKSRDHVDENGVDFISMFAHFDIVQYEAGDVRSIHNDSNIETLVRSGELLLDEVISVIPAK